MNRRMFRIALALWLSFGSFGPAAAQNTVDQARDLISRDRYHAAVLLLVPLADLGNVEAQHELGRAMVYSPETTGDAFDEGLRWLQKAIDGGSVDALHTLGRVLLFGSAGAAASDPAQGIVLLEKAASRGHAPANEALGELYLRGKPLPADATKSCDYFRRAFEADRASGASGLERRFRTGEGLARDARKALALYALMRIDSLQHAPEHERLRAEVGRDVLAAADKDAARWRSRNVRRLPDWQIPLVPIAGDARALMTDDLRRLDRTLPVLDRERAVLLGRYPPIGKIRTAAKHGLEEIEQACEALGKRLVHDLVEQFTAPAGALTSVCLAELRGFDWLTGKFARVPRRKRLMRLSVSARRQPKVAVVKTLVMVGG